jgi:type II secretory pathway pseudopilin PulG
MICPPLCTKSVSWRRRGFTLVEILVSMVVLILLVILIVQVTDTASRTIGVSNKLVDAASQARLVFGSLDGDLSNLVKRPDVPFQGQNVAAGTATNLLCLISEVASAQSSPSPSPTSNRNLSVIAYQVAALANNNLGPDGVARQCLIRAGKAILWTTPPGYFGLDGTGVPVTFTGATFPTTLVPQAADYDILSAGVIRMVVGFQLYPDNQPAALLDNTAVTNARGQVVYSPPIRAVTPWGGGTAVNVVDLSRISAIVVGLVVIDLNSLSLLNSAQVAGLANAFAVPTVTAGSIPLPVQFWGAIAGSVTNLQAAMKAAGYSGSIPLPALQSVRVFSHFYPISPYASHL